jgi:hypothetical protein
MKFNLKKVLTRGTAVVAVVALALVLWPKGASAADLIDSGDVKDQSLFSRDFAPDSVGTSELKPNSTYFVNLSKGTQDLINSKSSKTEAKGYAAKAETNAKNHANVVADSAENAAKGYADANDEVGITEARAGAGYTTVAKPGYSVAYNKCDVDGQAAISGGFRLNGHASEAFSGADQNAMPEGLSVVASEPAAEKGGTLVNSYQDPAFPQTEDGAFQANAWAVTFHNTTDQDLPVRVWATCVSVN